MDVDAVMNALAGMFPMSPEERAEWCLKQTLDGLLIGPSNRGIVKDYLASHFRYLEKQKSHSSPPQH